VEKQRIEIRYCFPRMHLVRKLRGRRVGASLRVALGKRCRTDGESWTLLVIELSMENARNPRIVSYDDLILRGDWRVKRPPLARSGSRSGKPRVQAV